MDLDAFIVVSRPRWERLDALIKRRRLSGREADELVQLYQQAATDLSVVRSTAADPVLISRLSELLLRARAHIAGARENTWESVIRFFVASLPAALYRVRWWTAAVAIGVIAVATVTAIWVATTPEGLASMGSPEVREQYVYHAFAEYYDPGLGFASRVWSNNAWIAAQCVALGITGLWPAYALLQNAINVGAVAGLMGAYGELDTFFALILPHGMLELTSIFIAGGAGLKLFWTWIDPGRRPRAVALAQEGRALFTVAIGLVLTLLLSGVVEGFVTGSGLPTWAKMTIGAAALALVIAYAGVFGRRAVRRGHSGDLTQDDAGYELQYA
ncbi:stage II sporulation protein M [Rarobacter faecitabidus]|uniref:Putative membrane protein SpoIIM required for sporulation n=1 Tax=Rarobacter faecitabidus TaxID=13243 RepID=A0A542ZU87_RARFA|nr:stage II sporulation protein M [Rarobacter faecitabidus]TQL63918.1 putative membrane protein SpoIIM required for sporulation [Rarobacter faecitabidus]